jgi:hypothetical protein
MGKGCVIFLCIYPSSSLLYIRFHSRIGTGVAGGMWRTKFGPTARHDTVAALQPIATLLLLSPSMFARSIARPLAARVGTTTRCMSTVLRPFRFHVGASWAGKPPEPMPSRRRRKGASSPREQQQGFAPDSNIGRWRTSMLSRFAVGAKGRELGEDAFYVGDVRALRPPPHSKPD